MTGSETLYYRAVYCGVPSTMNIGGCLIAYCRGTPRTTRLAASVSD